MDHRRGSSSGRPVGTPKSRQTSSSASRSWTSGWTSRGRSRSRAGTTSRAGRSAWSGAFRRPCVGAWRVRDTRSRCSTTGMRSPVARRRSRSSRTARSPVAPTRAARATRLVTSRSTFVLALAVLCASILAGCTPGPPAPEPVARQYASSWARNDYQAMWSLVSDDAKAQVTEAGFLDRLPRVAQEMTLRSVEAKTGTASHPASANGAADPRRATIPLSVTFHTERVGDFVRETALQLVLVGEAEKAVWRIAWTPEAILPHLVTGRLVRMTRLATSRGRILARDGTELATFVEAGALGVVTGQKRSGTG